MSSERKTSSSRSGLKRILANIKETRSRIRNSLPKAPSEPIHPSPSSLLSRLPPPEDITSHLTGMNVEYELSRKASKAYMDKAVDLQFRLQGTSAEHQKRLIRAARVNRSLSNMDHLQTKIRNSQTRLYQRDLNFLVEQTVQTVASSFSSGIPEADDTDVEDTSSPSTRVNEDGLDGTDDEGEDGDSSNSNPDDEKALLNMSAITSAILGKMYDSGFKFPRRHEKIKLAEVTGLTYRQIGIWYSNRRERTRPDRRPPHRGATVKASHTRESTLDYTPSRSSQDGSIPLGATQSMISLAETAVHSDYDQLVRDEDDSVTEPDDSDGSAGAGSYQDDSRVPSLSTSVATLATIDYTPSPALDVQLPPFPEPWTYTSLPPDMLDLTVPLPPTEPSTTYDLTNVDFSDLHFADLLAGFSPQNNTPAGPSWQLYLENPFPSQPLFPFSPVTMSAVPAQPQAKPVVLHPAPEITNERPAKRSKHGPAPSRPPPSNVSRATTSPRSRTSPQHRAQPSKRNSPNAHRSTQPATQRAIAIAPKPQPETVSASTSLRPIMPMPTSTTHSSGRAIKGMPSSKGRVAPAAPSGGHAGMPRHAMVRI